MSTCKLEVDRGRSTSPGWFGRCGAARVCAVAAHTAPVGRVSPRSGDRGAAEAAVGVVRPWRSGVARSCLRCHCSHRSLRSCITVIWRRGSGREGGAFTVSGAAALVDDLRPALVV
jgi:hypothetical protein